MRSQKRDGKDALTGSCLAELTQLDVSVTISYNGSKVANLPAPPYRHGLTSLRLWAFKIVPSAEVLRPIFAISATTLKMLKIVVTRETSEILSSVLPLVAASLTYLSLECLNNFPPSFLAALNQCTALKSLQYNVFMPDSLAYLKGALENVPTKLDRLLIDAGKDIDEAAYLACLQDPKSTQNLKTLVAFGSNQNKYKIPVSIGRECESRGIEFMTGVSRFSRAGRPYRAPSC